jgi:hypothetical protein
MSKKQVMGSLPYFIVVCYTISLWGCEGVLLDLLGLNTKSNSGGKNYVVFTLLGQIKGESRDGVHLIPCVPVTFLGIDVRASLIRLIKFKKSQGR